MGPRSRRFWFPLTRLGALFVGVVVAGNIVFHAFQPAVADRLQSPDEAVDYFSKKKKRIQKQFFRTLEKFLGAPAGEKISLVLPDQEVAVSAPAAARATTSTTVDESAPAASPVLGFIEPEPAPFLWPEPLPAWRPGPKFDLPVSLGLVDEASFRADLIADLYRRCAPDPVADVGDAILRGPELILDGIFTCASGMSSRPAVRAWEDDEDRCLTAQMLNVQLGPRTGRIWSEFMNQWTDRERKYFSGFDDTRADTAGFQDRTSDADYHELMLDQRKVFWDALRRTYLARYKVQAEEKIRDEAWYLDRWSGADFVVLPPLLGGYVFYRGLDKRFSVAGTRILISIEPVSEWVHRKRDLSAAAALEWTMKDWPLGVIVSAGLHDGRFGLDFVGIGTSLGTVRRALAMQEGEKRQ